MPGIKCHIVAGAPRDYYDCWQKAGVSKINGRRRKLSGYSMAGTERVQVVLSVSNTGLYLLHSWLLMTSGQVHMPSSWHRNSGLRQKESTLRQKCGFLLTKKESLANPLKPSGFQESGINCRKICIRIILNIQLVNPKLLLLLQSRKGGIFGVIFAYMKIGYLYWYSNWERENQFSRGCCWCWQEVEEN